MEGDTMKKMKNVYIFLGFAVLCWVVVAGWAIVSGRLGSSVDPVYNDVINGVSLRSDYVYRHEETSMDLSEDTWGALLPVPEDNSELTAAGFAELGNGWDNKMVLVVCFQPGLGSQAVTTYADWQTPFGVVTTEGNAVDHLVQAGAVADNELMKKADDLLSVLPYFSYYFPDKRIVPLAFDDSISTEAVLSFMERLAEDHDGYCVIVLCPYQPESSLLPLPQPEELAELFDSGSRQELSGVLLGREYTCMMAMKQVLKYDGNRVRQVLCDEKDAPYTFDELAVFFGKEL